MKKKIIILFFLSYSFISFSQSNVRNELDLKNTQIFYFSHNKLIVTTEHGKSFFKPYLSYVDKNDIPLDQLMDSFILLDFFYHVNDKIKYQAYQGKYDERYLNNYLDNVFKRTRLPIIIDDGQGNKSALIGANKYSELSYKVTIPTSSNNTEFKLGFDLEFDPDYFVSETSETNVNDILIGWEFFNSQENKINLSAYCNGSDSDWLEFKYHYATLPDEFQANSSRLEKIICVPHNFDIQFVKFHIMNYNTNLASEIKIDNVVFKEHNSPNSMNLVEAGDDSFSTYDYNNTKWEFNKRFHPSKSFLFKDRDNSITKSIIDSRTDILNSGVDLPLTKLVLTLPEINFSNYDDQNSMNELKVLISDFITNIQLRYIDDPNNDYYQISGVYMLEERIKGGDNNDEENYIEILTHVNDILPEGWKLYGSPYAQMLTNCSVESSFSDDALELFDVVWQQPNAFFQNFNKGIIDPTLLKDANNLASNKNLNINIENRTRRDTPLDDINSDNGTPLDTSDDFIYHYPYEEEYGRINDYFDYGDKYGFINYAKVYYDDTGAHYNNCYSSDEKNRVDYDNLYKFIKKSENGVVINNRFEILDDDNPIEFHNWTGDYSVNNNIFSSSYGRELKFTTTTTQHIISDLIPINDEKLYHMTFRIKKSINNTITNNALVGVRFYDKYFTQLSNPTDTDLTYSTHFSSANSPVYYKYLSPSYSNYSNHSINFNPPTDAIYFTFFLRKWKNSDIEWKSLKFYEDNYKEESVAVYKNNSSYFLKLDNKTKYGNYSLKLDNNKYAKSKEKFSISNNKTYKLKISSKEDLPMNGNNKALIAIETFKKNGQITNSNIIGSNGNWLYSNDLEMNYRYIPLNSSWEEFEEEIQFGNDVASIKLYLHNWHNENTVLFDNIEVFENNNSINLIRTLADDAGNLLLRNHWNEKLPLSLKKEKPILYDDFIDVSNASKLTFDAFIRGAGTEKDNKELLAIEFYDENFNFLDEDDLNNFSGLAYSDYYKYWWDGSNYIGYNYINCNDHNRTDLLPYWYNSQWKNYTRQILIPTEAKYIKLMLHKLGSNEKLLILNPKLKVETLRGNRKNKNITSSDNKQKANNSNNNILLFPNPAKNEIGIASNEIVLSDLDFQVFDLSGKLLIEEKFNNNSVINIEKLVQGVYFLILKNEEESYYKKFIKE